jgi:hypothetical protein
MINHWCQHPYMLPQEIVWKWVPASNNPPSSSLFVAAVRWLLPILPPVALELHGSKTSFGTWHGVPSIRCSFFLCWPSRKHTTTYWNPFLPTSSLHVMFQICWLVVLTILKTISQWEGLSHILWKKKHVPNHQPVWICFMVSQINRVIYSQFSSHSPLGKSQKNLTANLSISQWKNLPIQINNTKQWHVVWIWKIEIYVLLSFKNHEEYHPISMDIQGVPHFKQNMTCGVWMSRMRYNGPHDCGCWRDAIYY